MATTPEGIIPDLLLARMASLPFSPALQVANLAVPFTPPAGIYLAVSLWRPNRTLSIFLANSDPKWFRGFFQLDVVAPRTGEGIIEPSDVAGTIADDLADATISGDGITIKIDGRPDMAAVIIEPDKSRIPITIYYRCFA